MHRIICKSMAMFEAAKRIERAAQVDSPVLIWGEEGTGKKLVAETIHRRSRRSDDPLVVFSTRTFRGGSVENELFGTAEQPSRLAAAAGGTLLIDEITGLPPTGQVRLLNVIERQHRVQVQDPTAQPIDFRLMATSRYAITESIARGVLREDLHYRLGVVTIRVPPLQQRREDIPELVEQILDERCTARGKPPPAVDAKLMQHLIERPWPGNVRELREFLDTMLTDRDPAVLTKGHLPRPFSDRSMTVEQARRQEHVDTLAELERAAITRALELHDGNRTQAAETLGVSVRTLQRKLKQRQD